MQLSTEQEGKLILSYSRLIWSLVRRFLPREDLPLYGEDCFQECVTVLLKKIRSVPSLEEVENQFPFFDMRRAMQTFMLSTTVLRYPKTTTRLAHVLKGDRKKRVVLPDGFEPCHLPTEPIQDADSVMDYGIFLDDLTDLERSVLEMRLKGIKNGQIAEKLGIPGYKVTRLLHGIQKKYLAANS